MEDKLRFKKFQHHTGESFEVFREDCKNSIAVICIEIRDFIPMEYEIFTFDELRQIADFCESQGDGNE